MIESNKEIRLKGEDVIDVLNEIEIILISLRRIDDYFAEKDWAGADKQAYESETNRFIGEWRVSQRLARVRTILSEKFDNTLGDDDMDDLGRAVEGLDYWTSPGSKPKDG